MASQMMLLPRSQRPRTAAGRTSQHGHTCRTVSASAAEAWSSTGSVNPNGHLPGDSVTKAATSAQGLVEQARETILSDEGSTQYLSDLCGHYELSDAQRCVLQELEQAMTRASKIFWVVGFSIVSGAVVEGATSGSLDSMMAHVANTVHYVLLALLTATASRSFFNAANSGRGAADGAPGDRNALPSVMIAVTRLSSVLSQISCMALATMVVTVISATQLWSPLQLFTGVAIAAVMLTRGVACMMLISDRGSTQSIVSAAATIQSKSSLRSWKERFAVLVAASNALHYPFLTAFNKARVQRVREHNQQHRRGKSGGTAPVTTGAAAGTSAARAAAAGEGVLPPLAVDQVEEPGAKRDKPGGRRGLDGEVEYEFNQGEQLMLQVMTDEMRMAGYNHIYLSLAVILFFAAHIGTGDFLQSILNLLMLNDTVGTALVMFMVAKHFETAVVTSGNDITSLMRGLGSTSGLTKLFCRVGNLAKGVIIGQAITIIWNIHPLFKKLISKFILS